MHKCKENGSKRTKCSETEENDYERFPVFSPSNTEKKQNQKEMERVSFFNDNIKNLPFQ